MNGLRAPRGTHDVLPGRAPESQPADERIFRTYKWQALEACFRSVCARFGAEEIRTPLFELTAVFRRSVGEETDIVAKEMYEFEDRGGESLCLRPEGTAGVMRSLVEHPAPGLRKLYYLGPIFRYERPQRGRYRQHHQVGVEYVGGDDPAVDVEVISLGLTYLRELGLDDIELQLNSVGTPESRPRHRAALLAYLAPHLPRLSEDSQRRAATNPLRVLDSKDPRDQEVIAGAPRMLDYLEPAALDHFRAVCAGLEELGLPYTINGRLVRGLDYYQLTAFEVIHGSLGSQNVVLGGGRYDGLTAAVGGDPLPGVGFGSGVERALLILEALGRQRAEPPRPDVYLVARSTEERCEARRLAAELRAAGLRVEYDLLGRSIKAQLRGADGSGAPYAVFVRDDRPDTLELKRLADGEQVTVARRPIEALLSAMDAGGLR